MRNTSRVIGIRHGKTQYTNKGLDITPEGLEETKQTARELAPTLAEYEKVIVITSPLARTRGTAQIFLDELGMHCEPKAMGIIRCVDIHDLSAFEAFNEEYETTIYGEMWLTNPMLAADSDMAEGRDSVNRRAEIFLRHILRFLKQKQQEVQGPVCILVFSHFEILSHYLRALYPAGTRFPSKDAPGLMNSEPVSISLSPTNTDGLIISTRGLQNKVSFDEIFTRES